jgi:hypothetical protein
MVIRRIIMFKRIILSLSLLALSQVSLADVAQCHKIGSTLKVFNLTELIDNKSVGCVMRTVTYDALAPVNGAIKGSR